MPAARALAAADNAAGGLTVKVLRATSGLPDVRHGPRARSQGPVARRSSICLQGRRSETDARFNLPVEIRNDIARIEIASERSAGAVQLLDKRSRRRTVGIVSAATADTSEPLLSSSYYISARWPLRRLRVAQGEAPADAVTHFIDQKLPMLILADVGTVAGESP